MTGPTNTRPTTGYATDKVVSLSHVTLRYDNGTVALDDIDFEVAAGERICVLGANGSGKSTLASVVCGLLAPDEGEVELLGRQVFGAGGVDFEAYRLARHEIGLVFQNPDDQIVTSIVEDDVAFGPENLGVPSAEIAVRVERELARVGLTEFSKADPSRLSGGQKQRVAIAGALAMEPSVLVLDEPGALLDVRGRRSIMRVMDSLHADGSTIIHITHFMEEATAADRVVVLDHGRVVLEGTPTEVFSHSGLLSSLGLDQPFVTRLAGALRERGLKVPWTCDEDEVRRVIAAACKGGAAGVLPLAGTGGRTAGAGDGADDASDPDAAADVAVAPQERTAAETCIEVDHVTYSYGGVSGKPALRDVSISVDAGSSVAIVGQTGSGKSTLIRLVSALETPDSGRVVVNGIDTSSRRNRRRLHGRVGYVMQHPERQLFAETVLEDVAYGPKNLGLSPEEVDERCRQALELVGLVGREDASPFQLSGGQQRLCAIAGIIAMRPATLVLDEPTAGLDPRGRLQLERILARIHARGTTVIRVTHSMDDAARAEQVIVLGRAHVLMHGTPAEVYCKDNEKVLHDHGLGLPNSLTWALALEADGVSRLGAPLTLEGLADAIVLRVEDARREVGHGA